jgi:DNA repair exonuclease SbcCD ATPase subunit
VAVRRAEARAAERSQTLLQAQESISDLQGHLSEAQEEAAQASRLRDALAETAEALEKARKARIGCRGVGAPWTQLPWCARLIGAGLFVKAAPR